jgi:hypothetical protein
MNNLFSKSRLAIVVALGVLGSAACAPPPVMITNGALGDRVVRFAMQRNTEGAGILAGRTASSNPTTFNLLMQACTVGPDGQPSNCRGVLVLDRVAPGTLY